VAVGLDFVEPGKPGGIKPTRSLLFAPVESSSLEPVEFRCCRAYSGGGGNAGSVLEFGCNLKLSGGTTRSLLFAPVESSSLEPVEFRCCRAYSDGGGNAGSVLEFGCDLKLSGGTTRSLRFAPVESSSLEPVEFRCCRAYSDGGGNAGSVLEFGCDLKLSGGNGLNGDSSVGRFHAASECCRARRRAEHGLESTFQQFRGRPIAPVFFPVNGVDCTGNSVHVANSTGNSTG